MSTHPTLFVLGRTPNLSAAELVAVFRRDLGRTPKMEAGQGFLVVQGLAQGQQQPEADSRQLIAKLGGTVKIGAVLQTGHWQSGEEFINALSSAAAKSLVGKRDVFGLSFLSARHHQHVKRFGMAVKRALAIRGIRARFVMGEGPQLSSVTVEREGLLTNGAEILIGEAAGGTVLARTEAVQPFEALSRRDYGRPRRDVLAGMLPPKLAMMLINLSGLKPQQTLLDPFCGSGTILQEAELLGFTRLIGTDTNPAAVAATRENMKWLLQHASVDRTGVDLVLRQAPFTELPRLLGEEAVDGIVTEPYLGPPLRRTTHPGVIRQAVQETSILYGKLLTVAARLLKPGGALVMVVPMFRTGKQTFREPRLRPDGFLPQEVLPPSLGFDRRLIYGRPDQHVFRKILVLKRR